jgi:hypothetical protein
MPTPRRLPQLVAAVVLLAGLAARTEAGSIEPPLEVLTLEEAQCQVEEVARFGSALAGGGTLVESLHAALNRRGEIVFSASVADAPHDRLLALATGEERLALARGCSQPSPGCGDPTPLGGRFGDLPLGPPRINEAGDVLFLAEVDGGAASLGLFLYERDNGALVKVAALGDAVTGTMPLDVLGVGDVNAARAVVFLGSVVGDTRAGLFRWTPGGGLERLTASGQPAPGGGNFNAFVTCVGSVFCSPAPALDERGSAAFWAGVGGSPLGAYNTLFRWQAGTLSWWLDPSAPSPFGGRFQDILGLDLDRHGRLAVLGTGLTASGVPIRALFVERADRLVSVLRDGDELEGRPITLLGELSFGLSVRSDGGDGLATFLVPRPGDGQAEPWIVLASASGALLRLAAPGDPAPGGGLFRLAAARGIASDGQLLLAGEVEEPPEPAQLRLYRYSRCQGTGLFADGFESGDLSAWEALGP